MGFITITLLVYSPLLQGKKLLQSDSVQYKGMARELQEEREKNKEELYWIDNAFGGMPTYQLGAKYPYDILTPIHKVVRLLPAPAFLLFLYFLGSYLFLLAFGFRLPFAVLGALAYGFSTYLLIIIQVGHNTKAQALGYMPMVLAAVHLLFTKNRGWGIFFHRPSTCLANSCQPLPDDLLYAYAVGVVYDRPMVVGVQQPPMEGNSFKKRFFSLGCGVGPFAQCDQLVGHQ